MSVLRLLSSLVDRSLVIAEERDGHTRYRMLETVRLYASERVAAAGEERAVRERHRDFFTGFAEHAGPKFQGPEQARWLARVEEEHDNIRRALDCPDASDGRGLRAAGALAWFWLVRGHLGEGRERLAATLDSPVDNDPERARALNGAGNLAWAQGDYQAARALHEQALAIRRELGDKAGIAGSLGNLGILARAEGDLATARALQEESLSIQRELGASIAHPLMNLGILALDQGDHAAAGAFLEESLAVLRELGDKGGMAYSLTNLAILAHRRGDLGAARALHEEALEIWRELGDRGGTASSLNNLGDLAAGRGDLAAARALLEEALSTRRDLGDKAGIASSLVNIGMVACEQGDLAAARALLEESLAILRDLGDARSIANGLAALAVLGAAEGSAEPAARLAGAAAALRERIGARLSGPERAGIERGLEPARAVLGEAAFARALGEGRALSVEDAISLVLETARAGDEARGPRA